MDVYLAISDLRRFSHLTCGDSLSEDTLVRWLKGWSEKLPRPRQRGKDRKVQVLSGQPDEFALWAVQNVSGYDEGKNENRSNSTQEYR